MRDRSGDDVKLFGRNGPYTFETGGPKWCDRGPKWCDRGPKGCDRGSEGV